MAQPQTFRFAKTAILVDDGTGTFTYPCGFEEITMDLALNNDDEVIMDCDFPDAPAWVNTIMISKQIRLSGQGLLDMAAMVFWQNWWFADDAGERDVRWFRDLTGAQGGGYFQAPAVLTTYQETGTRAHRFRFNVGLALNGKPTFVPAA